MTTLGSLTLSDHLILDGLETDLPVAMSVRRTLGGRAVVQSVPLSTAGRELTLSGEYHFTLDDIQAAQELARENNSVTLVHHRGTFQVRIVKIESKPAVRYADPIGSDWYSAVIYMVEV